MKKIFLIFIWLIFAGLAVSQTKTYTNFDGTRRPSWEFGNIKLQFNAMWLPSGFDRDAVTLRDRTTGKMKNLVVKDIWITGDDTTTMSDMGSWKTMVSTISKWNHGYDSTFSKIDVRLDTIHLQVGQINDIYGQLATHGSEIYLLDTAIVNRVYSTDYNGNTIASLINQTTTTISISASKINLSGAVTFSDFDATMQGTINSKADSSKVTSIIGNVVTTGYIDALNITASYVAAGVAISAADIYASSFSTDHGSGGAYCGFHDAGIYFVQYPTGTNIGSILSDGANAINISAVGGINLNGHALNFSDLAGTVTTAQTNLSTTSTDPTTTTVWSTPTHVFGTLPYGYTLGYPAKWIQIKVGTTTYQIPAY